MVLSVWCVEEEEQCLLLHTSCRKGGIYMWKIHFLVFQMLNLGISQHIVKISIESLSSLRKHQNFVFQCSVLRLRSWTFITKDLVWRVWETSGLRGRKPVRLVCLHIFTAKLLLNENSYWKYWIIQGQRIRGSDRFFLTCFWGSLKYLPGPCLKK